MKSYALNKDWDLAVTIRDDGLLTITPSCNHRVNYQIVRSALIANKLNRSVENPLWIDWNQYIELDRNGLPSNLPLLSSRIRALLSSFIFVTDVNLDGGEINIINDTLSISGVCFTSDCDTSKFECEVAF